ncbi:helix-turn-helix domain-containing protein [Litchfieldella xinjiangensis]|uniref:helix-turn-helix domain-containing protein n=1 Tax=Litchfieldella xinjiangensis TaxID=1166948 RepID=UPI0006946648|nr:helix-turn-helix transcriptional regulator [Halomonas xinjiangensis]
MDTLGPRIKRLRQQANLNKAALARRVGVSDVTISYWESGAIKQIGHERLVALSDALGCSLGELLANPAKPSLPRVLVLNAHPPVPWESRSESIISLPSELIDSVLPLHCYLVTPGAEQHFDHLAHGDLAAVCATSTVSEPGLYVVEREKRIEVVRLDTDTPTGGGTWRVHGAIQAQWSLA